MSNLTDNVAALMREVAAREIMPRFRALAEGDVEEKSKGDLVTIADGEDSLAAIRDAVNGASDNTGVAASIVTDQDGAHLVF